MPAVKRAAASMLLLAAAALSRVARAQPVGVHAAHAPAEVEGATPAAAPVPSDDGFRERMGIDGAIALTRSPSAADRLRGLERLAADRSPESLAMLLRGAEAAGGPSLDPRMPAEGFARTDPRALLVVVRALATWTDRETARAALVGIIGAPSITFATRVAPSSVDPLQEERDGTRRVLLARREAAMALARAGDVASIAALVALARGGGPGQGAALEALASAPPELPSVFGGVALTTPAMVALAAQASDLRTIDAIAGLLHSSEPALRAAAVSALGSFGDLRALEAVRAALEDADPRVHVAAAGALVRLRARDAATAIEALVQDDRTAAAGLALAADVSGEASSDGIARAAGARAAASADPALRLAAVTALGRQTGPLGVEALAKLVEDPALEAPAAEALARSPSPAAMHAIEALAAVHATRRLAARAYFVRLYTRGESSSALDETLDTLAHAADSTDRAVGTQALVALGRTPLAPALEDSDPAVRRAAAMGAMARAPNEPSHGERLTDALLARIPREPDETTRVVLYAALARGDRSEAVPTADLRECATQGGADAPLAALALGRRARASRLAAVADPPADADVIDKLLASPDPVLRSHVAMGLGTSGAFGTPAPADAVGRLARAYAWEADDDVRRIFVRSLAAAGGGQSAIGRAALTLASSLDPDAVARDVARRALSGAAQFGGRTSREVAWLALRAVSPATAPPNETALFVRSDGLAVPIAFDRDGYALVAGIPPGNARVRLAPRLPAYSPFSP